MRSAQTSRTAFSEDRTRRRPASVTSNRLRGRGITETERSGGMRFLFARYGVGALRFTSTKGEIFAGSFVERDHQIVRRHAGRRGDAGADVFQECEPRFLRPPL